MHGWRKWKDLVHYHIAKNAGTTLRSVVTKRYGGLELHGPGKKAYGEYFNDAGRKWAGATSSPWRASPRRNSCRSSFMSERRWAVISARGTGVSRSTSTSNPKGAAQPPVLAIGRW